MRQSPLIFIWSGSELVGCVLPEPTAAIDTLPNQKELEIVRVFKEHGELKDRYKEHERLRELACMDECDGDCDKDAPYEKCPECAAGTLLNDLAEMGKQ